MKAERPLLGFLGALLCALPAAPLTWLLVRHGLFLGLTGVLGFLLALGGYRLLGRRCSGLGYALAVPLVFLASLPGLWYGYAELVLQDNAVYGCTLAEALELVPIVSLDPANLGQLLWDLGSILLPELLTAILTARCLRLRRMEKQA